jgi:hypothetical protein
VDDTSVRENPASVTRAPAGAAQRPRLLLFRSNLGLDGGATRFLALSRAARERGGEATIVAPPGPLAERAAKAGALELVDWPSLPGLERLHVLEQAARGKSALVTDCLPVNLSMVPALAANTHRCTSACTRPRPLWARPSARARLARLAPS